jgi:hypothetical protein
LVPVIYAARGLTRLDIDPLRALVTFTVNLRAAQAAGVILARLYGRWWRLALRYGLTDQSSRAPIRRPGPWNRGGENPRRQHANDAARAETTARINAMIDRLDHNPRAIELGWKPRNKHDEPTPAPTEENGL